MGTCHRSQSSTSARADLRIRPWRTVDLLRPRVPFYSRYPRVYWEIEGTLMVIKRIKVLTLLNCGWWPLNYVCKATDINHRKVRMSMYGSKNTGEWWKTCGKDTKSLGGVVLRPERFHTWGLCKRVEENIVSTWEFIYMYINVCTLDLGRSRGIDLSNKTFSCYSPSSTTSLR